MVESSTWCRSVWCHTAPQSGADFVAWTRDVDLGDVDLGIDNDQRCASANGRGMARDDRLGRRLTRWGGVWPSGLCFGLLAQVAQSPLQRLEPQQRMKLLGSLILLAIGGVALVVLAWLWMRVGRRKLRREDGVVNPSRKRVQVDDWARKPLTESLRTDSVANGPSGNGPDGDRDGS